MAERNGSQLLTSYLEFKGHKGQVPAMQSHGRHAEGGANSHRSNPLHEHATFSCFFSQSAGSRWKHTYSSCHPKVRSECLQFPTQRFEERKEQMDRNTPVVTGLNQAMALLIIMSFFHLVDGFANPNQRQFCSAVNSFSEQINPFKCQSSACVCVCVRVCVRACVRACMYACMRVQITSTTSLLTSVFSITVLWVLKYKICVIVYCDVVNVQPHFHFSAEIIK